VTRARRILLPFSAATLSRASLEEALATARAEGAVLVPVYLATVPEHLSLDAPLPRDETESALALLELIEQTAARAGVAVDARIERGRTPDEALAALTERERR
jgi:nucleotide-binding universal stress UspA family protein